MEKLKKKKLSNKWLLAFLVIFIFIGNILFLSNNVAFSEIIDNNNVVNTFKDFNFSITQKGSASWNLKSVSELEGSVTGVAADDGIGGCGGSDAQSKDGELIFTYNGTSEASIKFNYTVTINDGSYSISNGNISNGIYESNVLTYNSSISIYIKSAVGAKTTTIKITNIEISESKPISLTLLVPQNGTYYFNDEEIITEKTFSYSGDQSFTLKAVPDDGYELFGWIFNGSFVSNETTYERKCNADTSIYPKFILSGHATFKNENLYFDDLNDAINNAKNSSDKKIILIQDGIITGGSENNIKEYILDDGLMLYIPNDDYYNVYTDKSVVQSTSGTMAPYKTLNIDEYVTIRFKNNSSLYIAATCYGAGNETCGKVAGPYGLVSISKNSNLIFESSTKLYCYGYIIGDGLVSAMAGSTVYEFFQIPGWRGGTASTRLNENSNKVFLFNQYYIQNCESTLRLYVGASLYVYTGATMGGTLHTAGTTFIGTGGMFNISSGYVEKRYDKYHDRLIINIYGEVVISSFSIKVVVDVDTSRYYMPVNNNISINIFDYESINGEVIGSQVTVNQDLCLLPGSEILIDENSTLNISSGYSMILYDRDSWVYENGENHFASISQDFIYVCYSAGLHLENLGNKGRPTSVQRGLDDLVDAKIIVNGTININENAGLYVTGSYDSSTTTLVQGANICSTKDSNSNNGGYINYYGSSYYYPNTSTYQANQKSVSSIFENPISYKDIDIILPILRNNDETYVYVNNENPGQSFFFNADSGTWGIKSTTIEELEIIYKDYKTSDILGTGIYIPGENFIFPTSLNPNDKICRLILNGTIYKPNNIIENIGNLSTLTIYVCFEGWNYISGNNYYYFYDNVSYKDTTGLVRVPSLNNTSTNIYLFNNDSSLSNYSGVYDHISENQVLGKYFIDKGCLYEEKGLYKFTRNNPDNLAEIITDYLYINSDNTLSYSIEKLYIPDEYTNGKLPSGYYNFDSNGYIIRDDTETTNSNGEVYIKDNFTYIDGIKVSYGLFVYDSHYYYSNTNCEIVRDTTFYISKTNNLGISEGLYYFDDQGRMYDQNFKLIEVKQDETK